MVQLSRFAVFFFKKPNDGITPLLASISAIVAGDNYIVEL